MNHPKPEEWTPYVFGETSSETRRQLDAHLQTCAECRTEIATWRRSLRRLDAWKLPSARRRQEVFAPALRWATAAALVLCVGFGLGRVSAGGANVAQVRAALEPELRRQVQQEVARLVGEETDQAVGASTAAFESRRAAENQALLAALEKMQTQHLADYLALKKDIDTIAVNTDAGLRQTQQELVQLAVATPDPISPSPQQ